jgi:hypothetical protein
MNLYLYWHFNQSISRHTRRRCLPDGESTYCKQHLLQIYLTAKFMKILYQKGMKAPLSDTINTSV